jgi:hypothetical protein
LLGEFALARKPRTRRKNALRDHPCNAIRNFLKQTTLGHGAAKSFNPPVVLPISHANEKLPVA